MRTPFTGVGTALITPFKKDGSIDEAAVKRLARRQVDAGVHFLSPCGTTGEAPTLSHKEKLRVVELVVEEVNRQVPVLAGAGGYDTRATIELARDMEQVGADGLLSVTPYYNRPSQEGLYAHYRAINDAVQLPVFVYNVPGRTAGDISNETLARLSALPNIIGIKDATGDMTRVSLQRLMCGPEWVMLSGDDPTALGYMAHGGHGCISVTANVAPEGCAAFFDACMTGQWEAAREWQDRLIRLHKALFLDASPAPTKFALAHLGLCAEDCRLPITACADAARPVILDAMREAGIIQ